jgi:hypothetical protein
MTLLTEARALVLACGLAAAVSVTAQTPVVKLEATPEYLRPDPFGGIVAPDKGDANNFAHALTLEGARGGYVSFHLMVRMLAPGPTRSPCGLRVTRASYRRIWSASGFTSRNPTSSTIRMR